MTQNMQVVMAIHASSAEASQAAGRYTVIAIAVVVVGYFILKSLGVIKPKDKDEDTKDSK